MQQGPSAPQGTLNHKSCMINYFYFSEVSGLQYCLGFEMAAGRALCDKLHATDRGSSRMRSMRALSLTCGRAMCIEYKFISYNQA